MSMSYSMEEKIALVTGASDGIGKQVALELAQKGWHVIAHGRNQEKTQKAVTEIKGKSNGKVDIALADLSSFKQIRQLSDEIHKKYTHIDLLINNAGVQNHTKEITEDGLEYSFQVNHLAYFYVTSLLLDLVRNSDYRRIVLVSSHIHSEDIDFDNLQAEKGYSLFPVYCQTKLENLLFGYKLADLLKADGIAVHCIHPGMVNTHLNPKRSADIVARTIPVTQGSISTMVAGTSPDLEGKTGLYINNDGTIGKSKPVSYNKATQDRLWEISEELIGEKFRF